MRAYREMKKQGGAVRIDCYLPSEYKELLEQVCAETNSSMGEGICYLLDFYFESQRDIKEIEVDFRKESSNDK